MNQKTQDGPRENTLALSHQSFKPAQETLQPVCFHQPFKSSTRGETGNFH